MAEGTDPIPSCSLCRFWAPNLEGETAPEGVCRKLADNPTYYGSLITQADDRCDDWARMGVYQGVDGQIYEERRTALRTRIDMPARLHTASEDQFVRLADISEYGAGISLSNPPLVGMPGVLKWRAYQVFFTVAWVGENACGVMFDMPISSELVLETIRYGALKNERPAEPSRIALGQKRSRLARRYSPCRH